MPNPQPGLAGVGVGVGVGAGVAGVGVGVGAGARVGAAGATENTKNITRSPQKTKNGVLSNAVENGDECLFISKVIIVGDPSVGKSCLFNKMCGKEYSEDIPSTIGVDFNSVVAKVDTNCIPHEQLISHGYSNRLHVIKFSNPAATISSQNAQSGGTINIKGQEKDNTNQNKKKILSASLALAARTAPKEMSTHNKSTAFREYNIFSNKKNSNISIKLQLWDAAGQDKFRTIVKGYYRNSSIIILVFDLFNQSSFDHLHNWIDDIRAVQRSEPSKRVNRPLVFLVGNKADLKVGIDRDRIPRETIDAFCEYYNILSYHELSAKKDRYAIREFVTKIAYELYCYKMVTKVEKEEEDAEDLSERVDIGKRGTKGMSINGLNRINTSDDEDLNQKAICSCLLL